MKILRAFVTRDRAIKARAVEFISKLPDGELFEIVVRPYDPKRTLEQNGLAWAVVTDIAEQVRPGGQAFSKDVWWFHAKREHFGPAIVELPDGSFLEQEPTSRDKGKRAFSKFVDFLLRWSGELGVVLSDETRELDCGRRYG